MPVTTEIIVALIALCGSLCGSWLANRKTLSLMLYRLEQLEKKVDKHNGVIERTYKLEENERVTEEKIKVINHRIEDLEHMT